METLAPKNVLAEELDAVREMRSLFDRWANLRTSLELFETSPTTTEGARDQFPTNEKVMMYETLLAFLNRAKPLIALAESYDIPAGALGTMFHAPNGWDDKEHRIKVRQVLSRLEGAILKEQRSDTKTNLTTANSAAVARAVVARKSHTKKTIAQDVAVYFKGHAEALDGLVRAVAQEKPGAARQARNIFGARQIARQIGAKSHKMILGCMEWQRNADRLGLRKQAVTRPRKIGESVADEAAAVQAHQDERHEGDAQYEQAEQAKILEKMICEQTADASSRRVKIDET